MNTLDTSNANLLDIEAEHGNNIKDPKLAAFRTSLANIEGRTAVAHATLWAWKASNTQAPIETSSMSQNQTTGDTAAYQEKQAYKQKEAREKAKANYTNILLDYDSLNPEVIQHGNFLTAEDHFITIGMTKRETWK